MIPRRIGREKKSFSCNLCLQNRFWCAIMSIVIAALAQLVERRLGKAEVGGSNPLGSFRKTQEFGSCVFFSLWELRFPHSEKLTVSGFYGTVKDNVKYRRRRA